MFITQKWVFTLEYEQYTQVNSFITQAPGGLIEVCYYGHNYSQMVVAKILPRKFGYNYGDKVVSMEEIDYNIGHWRHDLLFYFVV